MAMSEEDGAKPAAPEPEFSGAETRRRTGATSARVKLIEACQQGGISLVLGAGVSLSRGIPTWWRLVQRLWQETFPEDPLPEVSNLPQFLPLALDLISRKLDGRFAQALRDVLYREVRLPERAELLESNETLAVLTRLLVREYMAGGERRIQRVITFNVDDLLETDTDKLTPRPLPPGRRVLKLVSRASHHPSRGRGEQAIPLYHLHGYLPRQSERARWYEDAADFLVFTDSQYWESVASPSSFANRVMSFALHDSRCVFIGLSMTDMNILRWLATRANEIEQDKHEQYLEQEDGRERGKRSTRVALERHFWIRADQDDPSGFLGRCLQLRGVRSIAMGTWGTSDLEDLLAECFPAAAPPPP